MLKSLKNLHLQLHFQIMPPTFPLISTNQPMDQIASSYGQIWVCACSEFGDNIVKMQSKCQQ
jgi:hypothetical protein